MAVAVIPEPGLYGGPCAVTRGLVCDHLDCRELRRRAASVCLWCNKPIGYATEYCRDDDHGNRWVHSDCAETAADTGRIASRP